MIRDAVLVTISCVLFVNMGLSEAIQNAVDLHLKILSCPKCCTMWSCLATLLLRRYDILDSIAASFIASYAALWLTLVYDFMAVLYNDIYELFTETDTDKSAATSPETEAADPDAVSKM